jgi:hypothetical protein
VSCDGIISKGSVYPTVHFRGKCDGFEYHIPELFIPSHRIETLVNHMFSIVSFGADSKVNSEHSES